MFFKELFKKNNYIPEYLEKQVYAISKTKFLIPLKLKIYFVQTEGNELIYIVEIIKLKDFQKHLENNTDNNLKCIVITDDNFFIQFFTPNCVKYLKLDDSYINANYNIVNYIKELKNEYLKKINDIVKLNPLNSTLRNLSIKENSSDKQFHHKVTIEKDSFIEKKKVKKDLIESKYLGKNEITWRISNNSKIQNDNIFSHSLISSQDNNYIMNVKNFYEIQLLMEIKKIIINKELIGYYFIFKNKSRPLFKENNFSNYYISSQNDYDNKSVTRKKKYQYLFQCCQNSYKALKKKDTQDEEIWIKEKESKTPKKVLKLKSYDKFDFSNYQKLMKENNTNFLKIKNKSSKYLNTKYNSDLNNEENQEYITIKEDYIPESNFHFIFDVTNCLFKPLNEIKNEQENTLNGILKFQALKIINSHKNILRKKQEEKLNSNESDNNSNSNESEESEYEDKESLDSSSIDSNYDKSIDNISKSSISKKNPSINKKNKKENLNNEYDSDIQKIKQLQNRNDIYNNFYKVNLSKVRFSIYDFNRDMIVDSHIEKISKIENIIQNAKSRLSVELKNSEEYPNIAFSFIKESKKKEKNPKNDSKTEKISDEKIIENKILEAINKEEDEEEIVKTYKYSLITIVILLVCAGVYFYFEIISYFEYGKNLNIIRNILSIKYCNKIGLYYIRELTLLITFLYRIY